MLAIFYGLEISLKGLSFKNEHAQHRKQPKFLHRPVQKSWLMNIFYRRFFSQQFKRSCLPDGPKVGTVALSPRGDWRMQILKEKEKKAKEEKIASIKPGSVMTGTVESLQTYGANPFKEISKPCPDLFGRRDIYLLFRFFRNLFQSFHAEADLSVFDADDLNVYLIAYVQYVFR